MITIVPREGGRTRRNWRTGMDPLRGLTPTRVRGMLAGITEGRWADFMWLLAAPTVGLESRDATLLTIVERRLAALGALEWKVAQVSEETRGYDPVLAQEQGAALRQAYEAQENLYEVIESLGLASIRGIGGTYIERAQDGSIARLHPIAPWNLARRGLNGPLLVNPDALDVDGHGLPDEYIIPEGDLLVRYSPRACAAIAVTNAVKAALTERDWDKFVELFGIPSGIVFTPQNTDAAVVAKCAEVAEGIAQGDSAALPYGSDYKPNDSVRGFSPFQERLDWLQKQLVLAGTGGLLTVLNDGTGLGSGQSDAHQAAFDSLARQDARRISEVFRNRIDREVLARAFPGRQRLAYWDLAPVDGDQVGALIDHAQKLSSAGYRIAQATLEEGTGYALTPVAAAPVPSPFGITNREPAPASVDGPAKLPAPKAFLKAGAAWELKLLKELESLPDESDSAAYKASLEDLSRRLPDLMGDPAMGQALAEDLIAAVIAGAASKRKGSK